MSLRRRYSLDTAVLVRRSFPMISERGRRITYIESILELRRQEEKRLQSIISSKRSIPESKARAQECLARLLNEMKVEADELEALRLDL